MTSINNRHRPALVQMRRAELIKRLVGTHQAALYLRNRNYSLEAALYLLARQP